MPNARMCLLSVCRNLMKRIAGSLPAISRLHWFVIDLIAFPSSLSRRIPRRAFFCSANLGAFSSSRII
jgi:hypothetical protein